MPLYRRPMVSYDVMMTGWMVGLIAVLSVTSAFSAAKAGDRWRRSKIIELNSEGQSSSIDLKGLKELDGAPDKRKKSSDLPHNLRYILEENSRKMEIDDKEEEEVDEEDQLNRDYVDVVRSANAFVRRSRRPVTSSAGPLRVVVDLLVVVDNELYRKALQRQNNNTRAAVQDIKTYYRYVIILVDSAYSQIQDSELTIRVRLAGIFIAKSRSDSPWSENHLLENGTALDASVGLEKFQEWLKEKHAELPNFDHAMAFTGYTMAGDRSGLGYMGTICQTKDGGACSIIQEDGGLSSANTAIHELGHGLGSEHDGENSTEECPARKSYIMATKLSKYIKYRKNHFLFSSCTIRQFKSVLGSKQGDCLFDSDPDNITILPGQVVSLDDQCKDFYGPTSGVCEDGDGKIQKRVCNSLRCLAPDTRGFCVTDFGLTAVLGTPCADGKVCKNGRCTDKTAVWQSIKSLHRTHSSIEKPLEQTSFSHSVDPNATETSIQDETYTRHKTTVATAALSSD